MWTINGKLVISVIISLSILIIQSCSKETETQPQKKGIPDTNPEKPEIYKGMYGIENSTEVLKDCATKRKFIISEKSDKEQMEKEILKLGGTKNKSYYIEAEGFTSFQQNKTRKNFDTVLVITRFLRIDTSKNCM